MLQIALNENVFKQYEYKKSFEQWGKNKVLKGNWTRVLLRVKQKIFHWVTESSVIAGV